MSVGLWIIFGLFAWTALALPFAVLVGRGIGGVDHSARRPKAPATV